MRYLTFTKEERTVYPFAILSSSLDEEMMLKHYIEPYLSDKKEQIIAYDLYKKGKKTPVKDQKEYLNELFPILMELGVQYLIVTDAEYFKTITKAKSTESALGYVLDSVAGDMKVVYCPTHAQIFYDPDKVKTRINMGLEALNDFLLGVYQPPGNDVIKFSEYPKTTQEISNWLDRLLEMDCDLTADIEGFSLKHYDAGIGSICFTWNEGEGISFPIDIREMTGPGLPGASIEKYMNQEVRDLLKKFFLTFKRKLIWHNISFDVYVLIYQLFMDDILDQEGLLKGLDVLLENWDCTRLITYLATNSCAGNKLGLKYQAQEFAGNYAVEDIVDITKIPMDKLLKYNLVDGLSTWYVFNKHNPTMVKDQQQHVYEGLFKNAIVDIIQMQLTGLPVDMSEVHKANKALTSDRDVVISKMEKCSTIKGFNVYLKQRWMDKKHEQWKQKRITLEEVPELKENTFNPNSSPQLMELLYGEDFMALPVLDYTKNKQPSTGTKTLEKLLNHTKNEDYLEFIQSLIDYNAVNIILTTFIPALLAAPMGPDGWHYLFGNFNLGGTLSGRLSSSDPNLQNLPASSRYAKLIKQCIKAPNGWLFVGLDFASLEDRISALTTKDPMKLKVYTDGYDGHCLRAYAYFTEKMPDIDPNSVDSINSIAKKYKKERGLSKAPTFALTYQGTYVTLMNNCGFSEELAKKIEEAYHKMYVISDQWVQDKLQQATKTGYVTCAFGLRLRTPLLKQVILNTSKTPYEAAAEGRTAGNALGQSWCLLNSRAASEFMKRVRNSMYRSDIRPCAHIHDAQYYLIRDNMEHVLYVNEHLVNAVNWQEDPAIAHDEVKLGGELSIFYPDWASELELPNGATDQKISDLCHKHLEDLENKKEET